MSAVLRGPQHPLVEPGPPLDADARIRYARQLALPGIGEIGQRRLAAARVLVVGAGGLGTPVLAALAAAGVGLLGVVDDDVVEPSNLHRQLLHGTSDVGRAKTASARDALHDLNPGARVLEHRERLTRTNAGRILAGYDLVVDGSDNFVTRYLVADVAEELGLPCVWGAVLGFTGQVSVFWPPHGPSYRDLHPEAPEGAATCATGGVLGMVCQAVGAIMAAEAVKAITGAGSTLLGRVLLFDALDASWRSIALVPDPGRAPAAAPAALVAAPPQPALGEGACSAVQPAVLTPAALAREIATRPGLVVIDVREPDEIQGPLPGALRIPLAELGFAAERLALDPATPVVTVCASGVRAARAAGLLAAEGLHDVRSLAGAVWAVPR